MLQKTFLVLCLAQYVKEVDFFSELSNIKTEGKRKGKKALQKKRLLKVFHAIS